MQELRWERSPDDDQVGYLYLPDHPGPGHAGVVVRQVALSDCIGEYKGPPVYLDFDAKGQLIGIEVVG